MWIPMLCFHRSIHTFNNSWWKLLNVMKYIIPPLPPRKSHLWKDYGNSHFFPLRANSFYNFSLCFSSKKKEEEEDHFYRVWQKDYWAGFHCITRLAPPAPSFWGLPFSLILAKGRDSPEGCSFIVFCQHQPTRKAIGTNKESSYYATFSFWGVCLDWLGWKQAHGKPYIIMKGPHLCSRWNAACIRLSYPLW